MNGLVIALTLCLANPAPGPVDGIEPRACYELSTYDSRTECTITAERVKVRVKGARLRCIARDLSPDERIQIARGGR